MDLQDCTLRDILGWDAVNWSACLDIWGPHVSAGPVDCLEIGCGPGGVSLWLASKGHRVVCSDLANPAEAVRDLHRRYGVDGKIAYEAVDCTDMPYVERFDVVVLKSVLGGVWAHCGRDGVERAVQGIHRALRPGGMLLFAENLRATALHMFCRRRLLRRTRDSWVYPTVSELEKALARFSTLHYQLTGFLGAFGRDEWQRSILGRVDRLVVPLVPRRWRYIMAGVAVKRSRQEHAAAPRSGPTRAAA